MDLFLSPSLSEHWAMFAFLGCSGTSPVLQEFSNITISNSEITLAWVSMPWNLFSPEDLNLFNVASINSSYATIIPELYFSFSSNQHLSLLFGFNFRHSLPLFSTLNFSWPSSHLRFHLPDSIFTSSKYICLYISFINSCLHFLYIFFLLLIFSWSLLFIHHFASDPGIDPYKIICTVLSIALIHLWQLSFRISIYSAHFLLEFFKICSF